MQHEFVRTVLYLSPVGYIVPDRSRRCVSPNDDPAWFPEQIRNFRLISGLGFFHTYLTVMTVNIFYHNKSFIYLKQFLLCKGYYFKIILFLELQPDLMSDFLYQDSTLAKVPLFSKWI